MHWNSDPKKRLSNQAWADRAAATTRHSPEHDNMPPEWGQGSRRGATFRSTYGHADEHEEVAVAPDEDAGRLEHAVESVLTTRPTQRPAARGDCFRRGLRRLATPTVPRRPRRRRRRRAGCCDGRAIPKASARERWSGGRTRPRKRRLPARRPPAGPVSTAQSHWSHHRKDRNLEAQAGEWTTTDD